MRWQSLRILILLPPCFACGSNAVPNRKVNVIEPAAVATSHALYTAFARFSKQDLAAKIAATGALSIGSFYSNILKSAQNDVFQLDEIKVAGSRTRLQQSASIYAALDAKYPNMQAYWDAIGYNPRRIVAEAEFVTEARAALAAASDRQRASSLDLLETAATGTAFDPLRVPEPCNIYETSPPVATADRNALPTPLPPGTFLLSISSDSAPGAVYVASERPTERAQDAVRYFANFDAAVASAPTHTPAFGPAGATVQSVPLSGGGHLTKESNQPWNTRYSACIDGTEQQATVFSDGSIRSSWGG